ncbi:MAG: c-type cytochrome biogenesis protein CcmI, partial [Rhodovarius sp.]|nr:c-type cytochrome biogenesis protein CcmI [Rhodovarius sp.]
MTWAFIAALAALLVLPLLPALRGPAVARDRAEADRALFQAQLAELERERAAGRLSETAYRDAVIEVQRRLLAAPAPEPAQTGSRAPLVAALIAIPIFAIAFYMLRGEPNLPSASFQARQEAGTRDELLLRQLRERLAGMPQGEVRRQGLILLGNAERSRGRRSEAAAAWQEALEAGFDPGLAADLSELLLELGRHAEAAPLIARALAELPQDPRLRFLAGLAEAAAGRSANARAAWQALLNDSPPNAPWRPLVEQRLR